MRILRGICVAASLTGVTLSSIPANAQSGGTTYLQTITITSTRTERSIKESPRSTYVLDGEELERKQADSVAEMLRDVPGVELVDANTAGMKRLRIRGESSRRVTVLLDGQEITDHSTYGTPILIDPDIIDRIDVIRGPASVLYGTKSIGGVINIITKRGGPKPAGFETSNTYYSATSGYHGSASLHGSNGSFDYRLFGALSDHDDRDVAGTEFDPTGKLQGTSFNDDSLFAHLGFRFGANNNHYLQFKADRFRLDSETWTDPDDLGLQDDGSTLNSFSINLPQRDREKYAVFYDVTDIGPVFRKFHIDAYHQTVDRLFTNDIDSATPPPPFTVASTIGLVSDDTITNKGTSLQVDLTPFSNHYVIAGAQYLSDELDKALTADVFVRVPMGPVFANTLTTETDLAETETLSAFIQDEWTLRPGLKLTGGMRQYWVSTKLHESNHEPLTSSSDQALLGSVGLTKDVTQADTVRLLFSQGYVYPTLLQLFVPSSAGGDDVFSNSDLSAETSNNYEAGWRHDGTQWLVDLAAFYTTSKDYLQTVSCGTTVCPAGAGVDDFIWQNIDASTAFGLELLAQYAIPNTTLTTYVTGAWTKRQLEYATFSTYNSNIPEWSGRFGLRKEWNWGAAGNSAFADLFVRAASGAEYTQSDGTFDEEDGWATLNFSLGTSFGPEEKYRFLVSLNNITDESYRPTVDELPGYGRSVEVTAKIKLN